MIRNRPPRGKGHAMLSLEGKKKGNVQNEAWKVGAVSIFRETSTQRGNLC